jgi:hypothetical protein
MTMNPPPPSRRAQPTAANVTLLQAALTSVIAGQPAAVHTYTFYEDIDSYLAFGGKGYPIEYGKYYNIAFTQNERLMNDTTASQWIQKTTILLQEAIRDFLVERFKKMTLHSVTIEELRDAAFDSHPRCYDEAGLKYVLLLSPELIPIIALIPYKEYLPQMTTGFVAGPVYFLIAGIACYGTLKQMVITAVRVIPPAFATGVAYTSFLTAPQMGLLQRGVNVSGPSQVNAVQTAIVRVASVKQALESGRLDNLAALTFVVAQLTNMPYPDLGSQNFGKQVISLAQLRMVQVKQRYSELKQKLRDANTPGPPGVLNFLDEPTVPFFLHQ